MLSRLLGLAAWLTLVLGGGALLARHDAGVVIVPELRFAGVDLLYALRRVAAEANLPLTVDELRAKGGIGDLAVHRLALDLPPGTPAEALAQIRAAAGGFDYRLDPGLIYVRSDLAVDAPTPLDRKRIPAGRFEGNVGELIRWLMQRDFFAFLDLEKGRGTPIGERVELDIPEASSAIDVLLQYTRASGNGWRLVRGGYPVELPPGVAEANPNAQAIVPNTLLLLNPLNHPLEVPAVRRKQSVARAIAHVSLRTGVPVCVEDLGLLSLGRGSLDHASGKVDPGSDIEESMEILSTGMGVRGRHFAWERRGRVILVRARALADSPGSRRLLDEKLRVGRFEGTLPEFANWLNANRQETSNRFVMGGEITAHGSVASLEIPADTTVEEALLLFATETGECWTYVVHDALDPSRAGPQPERAAWVGAWLTRTRAWSTPPALRLR